MNPVLSAALVVGLVASAIPVAAQEKTWPALQPTAGPVAAAITREAIRLAAEGQESVIEAPVQPGDVAWSRVMQLAAGEDIRIDLGDATTYRGALRTADGASITLAVDGHDQHVWRARIRRVAVRVTHQRRNVLLGLVIGGASGGFVHSLHCGAHASCNEAAPLYFYPCAGVGAVIGALWPARQWQDIYSASAPTLV